MRIADMSCPFFMVERPQQYLIMNNRPAYCYINNDPGLNKRKSRLGFRTDWCINGVQGMVGNQENLEYESHITGSIFTILNLAYSKQVSWNFIPHTLIEQCYYSISDTPRIVAFASPDLLLIFLIYSW